MPRHHAIEDYRNFGIMAHIDAGKTTTTERILYYTGKNQDRRGARGRRDDGFHGAGVRARHHDYAATTCFGLAATAASAASTSSTPGHVDFTIEVERSLRVLDGAVCVLDSNQGVEPQTETVWRQGDKYNVPRIIFSNKMDKTGADFFMCLSDIKEKLGARGAAAAADRGGEQPGASST